MSAAWEAWLAECLGALDIDADVFGPYVTGIMVRLTHRAAEHVVPCRRSCASLEARLDALWLPNAEAAGTPQEDETQQEAERASSVVRRCADA